MSVDTVTAWLSGGVYNLYIVNGCTQPSSHPLVPSCSIQIGGFFRLERIESQCLGRWCVLQTTGSATNDGVPVRTPNRYTSAGQSEIYRYFLTGVHVLHIEKCVDKIQRHVREISFMDRDHIMCNAWSETMTT